MTYYVKPFRCVTIVIVGLIVKKKICEKKGEANRVIKIKVQSKGKNCLNLKHFQKESHL